MPILYVRLVYTKPIPEVFEERFEDLEDDNILLADPVLEGTSETIGKLYREVLARYLRMFDIVVFRCAGPECVEAIASDTALKTLLPDRQGGALVSNATALKAPSWCPIPGMREPSKIPSLESLRQAEVEGILRRTGAIFESSVYHYVLPYQERHAEKFIRLADALRSIYDIDRILDWLYPAITGDTLVIGDTGSMLPLLYRLREHVQKVSGHRVEIATLDKYPEDRVDVTARIDAIKNRPFVTEGKLQETPPKYLFVISVSSSGRLCGLLHNLIPESTIAIVCRTTKDELPCQHHLVTVEIQNWPADKCRMCATHPRIHVDPQTYELIPHLDWQPVVVGQSKAQEKSKFWSMVGKRDAVELHRTIDYAGTAPESERHFSVLLDTRRIADDPWFRDKCYVALRELGELSRPDLLLIPQHKNSDVVAGICREIYPELEPVLVPAGKLEDSLREPLQKAKRILIADDAIVTGATLFNLRSAIYKLTQPAQARPAISLFVMISRTANETPIQSLERRYRDGTGVRIRSGEKIYLPEEQHCPWCRERDFLELIRGILPPDEEVAETVRLRIDQLDRKPLQWPYFMLPDDHGLKPDLKAVDSFFGTEEEPLSAPAAFAAGACVAQTMKMELGNASRSPKKVTKVESVAPAAASTVMPIELPTSTTAGPAPPSAQPSAGAKAETKRPGDGVAFRYADMGMVYGAFFETTLMSALLRTFDPVEVRHPGIDKKFEEQLKIADPVRAYPGAVTELAFAAVSGKVPKPTIRATLEKFKWTDRWFRMLLAIMDAVEAK